jgi:hypothetical protein
VQDLDHVQDQDRDPGGIHRADDARGDRDIPDAGMPPQPPGTLTKIMAQGRQRRHRVLACWPGGHWLEDAGQGEQQQHGNAQRPGADRERQDGSQPEQPSARRGTGQFVADDLTGDHPPVGAVQVGWLDQARYAGQRGSIPQRRPGPGREGRQVDQHQPGAVGQDRCRQRGDNDSPRDVHDDHQTAAVCAVDDDSQARADQQPRQALHGGDGRYGDGERVS